MKTIEATGAATPLAELAEQARTEPVIVMIDGKPVAALVPLDNADLETATLSNHPSFLAIIERSRDRHRMEGGISAQEMRRRLGL